MAALDDEVAASELAEEAALDLLELVESVTLLELPELLELLVTELSVSAV